MPQLKVLHVITKSKDPRAETKTGHSQINKFFYKKKKDPIVQQGIVWALLSYGFFFFTMPVGMWELSAPPGIKPVPLTMEALSLNHRTTRGSP